MADDAPRKKKSWKRWKITLLILVVISVSYYGVTKWVELLHWIKDQQAATPIIILPPDGK